MELNSDPGEPKGFREAMDGPEKKHWLPSAINEAMNFIKQGAWKMRLRKAVKEEGRKVIGVKWIFKIKEEHCGYFGTL